LNEDGARKEVEKNIGMEKRTNAALDLYRHHCFDRHTGSAGTLPGKKLAGPDFPGAGIDSSRIADIAHQVEL
jgi:hypothetical protein